MKTEETPSGSGTTKCEEETTEASYTQEEILEVMREKAVQASEEIREDEREKIARYISLLPNHMVSVSWLAREIRRKV